jgi:hypothetical protein
MPRQVKRWWQISNRDQSLKFCPVKMPDVGETRITKKTARHEFHSTDRYIVPQGCEYFALEEWIINNDTTEHWVLRGLYTKQASAEAAAERLKAKGEA